MAKKRSRKKKVAKLDERAIITRVLETTQAEVDTAEAAAKAGGKRFNRSLKYAIAFAKYMGKEMESILDPYFPGIESGEKTSRGVRGLTRVDVQYSTREAGLGLALSFKSVHFGERDGGNARFIHNKKRNDEELRVEATGHHLRQPYAVMAAVLFLPFESCEDLKKTSSFASWVEYLWPLKGRKEPDDAPDLFELVFIGLYARDGSELRFYEVGGEVPCPRRGRPDPLLTIGDFVRRLKRTYDDRNGRDFHFAGEAPVL